MAKCRPECRHGNLKGRARETEKGSVPFFFPLLLQRTEMRIAVLLLAASSLLGAADTQWFVNFDKSGVEGWHLPLPAKWEIADDGGNKFLRMLEPGPIGNPRRPQQFALWQAGCVGNFELNVKVRRRQKSVLLAFGFQDRLHFYYAHLSVDPGDHAVHNGFFKVDGGERVRIAGTGSAPALPTADWHNVRLVRDVASGAMDVFIDGQKEPRFHFIDKSFNFGWVGVGSFDETGDFDDFRLRGTPSGKCQAVRISPLDPQ
jgi:hypothetical protein